MVFLLIATMQGSCQAGASGLAWLSALLRLRLNKGQESCQSWSMQEPCQCKALESLGIRPIAIETQLQPGAGAESNYTTIFYYFWKGFIEKIY